MRKMLFVLVVLLVGGARADNIITSREYVDAQANTLQTTLPAKNTNTVLLNTATAGAPGAKAIYDSSTTYGAQTDALVTAGQFNTAVQNALESEFVCIERQNGNGGCLLYEIRSATQKQILPAGYTQLAYLESTGTQYIDTGITTNNNMGTRAVFQYTDDQTSEQILFGNLNPNIVLMRSNYRFGFAHKTGYGTTCNTAGKPREITTKHIGYINFMNDGAIRLDNELVCNIPAETFKNNKTLYLFAAHHYYDYNHAVARIYNLQLSNMDAVVHNFIPARRDSDNTLGMYDTVSGTFFTNRGTGTFIAGPVVSSNLYLPSGN